MFAIDLDVTQEDIDLGNKCISKITVFTQRATCCPIYQSLVRKYGITNVEVSTFCLTYYLPFGIMEFWWPDEIKETIRYYDRTGQMVPFKQKVNLCLTNECAVALKF